MKKLKYTNEQLEQAIKNSKSWRQVAIELGLNPDGGGAYQCLKRITRENNYDTSHFTGQGHNKGKTWVNQSIRVPNSKLFCKNSNHTRIIARRRIIKDKLIPHDICSKCGIQEWMGEKLVMVLDHINGDGNDHRLENLRFICPNCNSQLPTFAGRNKNGGSGGSRTLTPCGIGF